MLKCQLVKAGKQIVERRNSLFFAEKVQKITALNPLIRANNLPDSVKLRALVYCPEDIPWHGS